MRDLFKKVLLLMLFMILELPALSIHWQGNYHQALTQAKDLNQSLLVLVVKAGEKRCGEIIAKSLMNQPYIEAINQQMIAVMVTYEGSLSYPIELYYTTVFPTLFFVDSHKETFLGEPLYGEEINTTGIKNRLNQYSIWHN